jgi:hypothetical protein
MIPPRYHLIDRARRWASTWSPGEQLAFTVIMLCLATLVLAVLVYTAATNWSSTLADVESWSLRALAGYTAFVIVCTGVCIMRIDGARAQARSLDPEKRHRLRRDHAIEGFGIITQAVVSVNVLQLAGEGRFDFLPGWQLDALVFALIYILYLSADSCATLAGNALRLPAATAPKSGTEELARDAAEQMANRAPITGSSLAGGPTAPGRSEEPTPTPDPSPVPVESGPPTAGSTPPAHP